MIGFLSTLQRLRDQSETLLTMNYCAGQLLYRLGVRPHLSGSTHQKYSAEQGVEYVTRVFRDYLTMMGEAPAWLRGRNVLEVGSGDNYGVALLFAAHGARVHCLDRFSPLRDRQKNRDVYTRLANTSDPDVREALRGLLTADGDVCDGAIHIHDSLAIEDASGVLERDSFDLIVSRAVLEHVQNLARAWTSMDALLAPGGLSVHKVDFRNHGFYASIHPLAFLRPEEPLWRLVSEPDPTMNRQRAGAYQQLCQEYGYSATTFVTHWSLSDVELDLGSVVWPPAENQIVDLAEIVRYRSTLGKRFRRLEPAELGVAGIFLSARRN